VTTVKAGKLTKVWVIFTDEALCEEFHSKCCGGTDKLPVSLSLKYFQLHNRASQHDDGKVLFKLTLISKCYTGKHIQ